MNKLFLFLFISVLLVTTVNAQEVLTEQIPAFQFNKEFDLKASCFDNGFFCDNSFVCNMTLVYPDGSLLIDNAIMTNQNSYRNITVSQSLNNQLGFATGIESCNNGTVAGSDSFIFAITGDGKPYRQFPHQFVIIIFSFLLVTVGLIKERFRLFKHAGSILMMIMGTLTLYPGYAFINYSTLMGKGIGFILIGLGFYFLIEDSFSRGKQGEGYDQESEFVNEE